MNKLKKCLQKAIYAFMYEWSGNPEWRPYEPPVSHPIFHKPSKASIHSEFACETVEIKCSSPKFQRFLLGHAQQCLRELSRDRDIKNEDLPTYKGTLELKCRAAVKMAVRYLIVNDRKFIGKEIEQEIIDSLFRDFPN